MVFIDDLALVEVFLALAATVLAYGGVLAWWAIRTNNPKSLTATLKGMAVPVGGVGIVATALAFWGEIAWPFPSFMAGYNIFFWDALMLFGIATLAYAVSAYFSLRMQYVGLFALVAGGVSAFYGWTGYTAHPAFTKDPLDTLLLYLGFGAAGIFAFPATIIMDYYRTATEGLKAPFTSSTPTSAGFRRHFGIRGAQPIAPVASSAKSETPATGPVSAVYHVPIWVQTLLLLFPVFMALAAIAAFWYFGTTLPGHLGQGPGAAP